MIPDENTEVEAELYIQHMSEAISWFFIRMIKKKEINTKNLCLASIIIAVIDLVQY